MLLLALSEMANPVKRLLQNKLLVAIGALAYGVYLYQGLSDGLLHGIILKQSPIVKSIPDLMITCVAVILTLSVAAISFRFLEMPFIRFGQRFHYKQASSSD
jgi:peptidoglycan/LPS O-acetylase OafA/YrhL